MYCSLLFAALVALVTTTSLPSPPKGSYFDFPAFNPVALNPETLAKLNKNSTSLHDVSVDITIDVGSLLAQEESAFDDVETVFFMESDSANDSGAYSFCPYQLMAVAGVMVLLAVVITVQVYSLYIKRRRMNTNVVPVKDTV